MSKAKPLTAEQCEAAREAMLTGHSLSKISRCAGVVATIEYMLKDIRLLETYLQRMASAITQKREQISHSALLLSMFHYLHKTWIPSRFLASFSEAALLNMQLLLE